METIKNYLENIFRSLPKTDELQRLKNELLLNMKEKYHELKAMGKTENEAIGIVISEFGNIDELLNEMEVDSTVNIENLPTVSIEAAEKYIALKKKTAQWIGIGVVLCILSAAVLILTAQLINDKIIFESMETNTKAPFPVIFLLIIIVPAVALFIYSGISLEKFKYIEEGEFYISSSAKAILTERREGIANSKRLAVITGVCLCVLSPISLFVGEMLGKEGSIYGVCVLLLIVAPAVFLFIRFGSMDDAYKKLIMIEEYSPIQRKNGKVIGAVASVIWPLATCAFLLGGFVLGRWDISWIVFPITGILFGAFCSVYNAVRGESKNSISK